MRHLALLLALLLALPLAPPARAVAPSVNSFSREVFTGPLRVRFDLLNPDRLASILLLPWSGTRDIAGADLGGDVEFFGQSLRGTRDPGFTRPDEFVESSWGVYAETDSEVVVLVDTRTLGEPRVRTFWTFRSGSAHVRVERTIALSEVPDSSAFQPFVLRMAPATNYRSARWRQLDGTLRTGTFCFADCIEPDWDGRWVEFFAREGTGGYSVALAASSTNPRSGAFVRSVGERSYTASLGAYRDAGMHDADETHRFLLAFSTVSGDTAALDALQAELDATLPPLAAPTPAGPRLTLVVTPNPARGEARLEWTQPRVGRATLEVFDVSGRRVDTLFDGDASPGAHAVRWGGELVGRASAPAGVYLASLSTERGVVTRRIILVR